MWEMTRPVYLSEYLQMCTSGVVFLVHLFIISTCILFIKSSFFLGIFSFQCFVFYYLVYKITIIVLGYWEYKLISLQTGVGGSYKLSTCNLRPDVVSVVKF